MPIARGTIRSLASDDRLTAGGLIVTNDRWNATMSRIGVLPLRRSIEPYEEPYSVRLKSGVFAVAGRLVALMAPPHKESPFGSLEGVLDAGELAACEDALCQFLHIPLLLGPLVRLPPVLGAITNPLWGEVYYAGPPIEGQLKRYIVVSPNLWNAASGLVTLLRTTSQGKYDSAFFPVIQGGSAQACCGDTTTVPRGAVKFGPRDGRPTPRTTSRADMVSIARVLLTTHELAAAASRAGLSP